MEEDEVRRHALNCIIYGVAYIARKSYEHEGAKYFPEPIELVDEKTVTDVDFFVYCCILYVYYCNPLAFRR